MQKCENKLKQNQEKKATVLYCDMSQHSLAKLRLDKKSNVADSNWQRIHFQLPVC